MENYYSIFEIAETATQEEVKQAYRLLLQVWHPDRYQHNASLLRKAEHKTKQINIAFETLSDPVRRGLYDEQLQRERAQSNRGASPEPENNDPLVTRCPNPQCDLSLLVQSRSLGKVTCPSCRTSFLYDPVTNDKWEVRYPTQRETTSDNSSGETSPNPSQNQSVWWGNGTLLALIAWAAILIGGAILMLIGSNRNESVMTNFPKPVSKGADQPKQTTATSLPTQGDKANNDQSVQKEADGAGLQTGDDLIRPILSPGEGELTVVNSTLLDGAFKLYEESKGGGTLYRYWYIRSEKRFTLTDLGPCSCSLYFALGREWDHDLKAFRHEKQYGKYETSLSINVPKASENGEWKRYWVRIDDSPIGIESSTAVSEEHFNDLF